MVINRMIVFKGAFKTTNETNTRGHFDCSLLASLLFRVECGAVEVKCIRSIVKV